MSEYTAADLATIEQSAHAAARKLATRLLAVLDGYRDHEGKTEAELSAMLAAEIAAAERNEV